MHYSFPGLPSDGLATRALFLCNSEEKNQNTLQIAPLTNILRELACL